MNTKEIENLKKEYDLVWEKLDEKGIKNVMDFSEGYKKFMDASKTEREATCEIVKMAELKGFKNFKDAIKEKSLKAGDKVYAVNKGKGVALFVIGKEPIENGLNIVGSHIDSPRLDLKSNPLYEDEGFALLKTHYYGGLKKYQWVTIPLAVHGVIFKKNGEKLNVVIGEDDLNALKEDTPLLRLGTPKDISSCALFLASDAADFITGQIISPNGGFVI